MLKSFIVRVRRKGSKYLRLIADKIYPLEVITMQTLRVIPWLKIDGDKNLRLNYNLTQESVVFDLGGYLGDWSEEIYSMYGCNIYLFEPCSSFFSNVKVRFKEFPRIRCFNFGLSNCDSSMYLYKNNESSSVYNFEISSNNFELIELKIFISFINTEKIKTINLMKINIEGGEYDLLDYIIEKGLISNIENIQVQFHDFVPNAKSRMQNIQNKLMNTHDLTYQFEFVWENWKLKNHKLFN